MGLPPKWVLWACPVSPARNETRLCGRRLTRGRRVGCLSDRLPSRPVAQNLSQPTNTYAQRLPRWVVQAFLVPRFMGTTDDSGLLRKELAGNGIRKIAVSLARKGPSRRTNRSDRVINRLDYRVRRTSSRRGLPRRSGPSPSTAHPVSRD